MEHDTPTRPPKAWREALDRADEDLVAGRTFDFDEVLAEVDADNGLTGSEKQPKVSAGHR